MLLTRKKRREARKQFIRGTTICPRLVVFRSLKHFYVQLIDDTTGSTIVSYSSLDKAFSGRIANLSNISFFSQQLLEKMKEKNITRIVFDKNGFRYSGIISKLASEMRSAGIIL